MKYLIVMAVAAVAGVAAYVTTMRRSLPRDNRSFDPQGSASASVGTSAEGVTYIPVGADTRLSWQSRSVSALALVALIIAGATAIAVTLYQFGGMLVRFVIVKLQNS